MTIEEIFLFHDSRFKKDVRITYHEGINGDNKYMVSAMYRWVQNGKHRSHFDSVAVGAEYAKEFALKLLDHVNESKK